MNLTIFKYSMRRGATNVVSLIANCALPILIVLMGEINDPFGTGARREFIFLAIAFMYGAFYMARGIQSDKIDGTVVRILAGPVTMRDYFVQNFFAAMVPMTAVSVVVGALGMLLHGWEFQLTLGLILLYIMLSSTSIGLSFAWSCIFKNAETSTVVFSMLMMLVVFLSGMLLPLDVLPDILLYIGALFPGQWAVRGIESLLSYGFDGYMYWLSLLAMLMFAVAYLLYGGKRRII